MISNRREVVGLPAADYHADPALSRSDLKGLLDHPRKWAYRKEYPKGPTPALALGTAFHAAVLEPDTLDDVAAALCEQRSEGNRRVFTAEHYDQVLAMAAAVQADPAAVQLLTGRREVSYFWDLTLPVRGGSLYTFACKARPDVTGDGWLCDLKTTDTPNEWLFASDAEKYGYALQDPWYTMGATGQVPDVICASSPRFIFLAVEKDPPYLLHAYELPASWRLAAWEQCRQALLAWHRLTTAEPGTREPFQITELTRPRWAATKEGP